jgi:hypothetical protein
MKNELVSEHGLTRIERRKATGQLALHAVEMLEAGTVICDFQAASVHESPTYLTLQKEEQQHITLLPDFLQFVNHSCSPNVFFDTTRMEFITLRQVEAGEELCFFYPSAEWIMAQSFACYCGQPNCLGTISGAAFLDEEQISQYSFTDFIYRKFAEQNEKTA